MNILYNMCSYNQQYTTTSPKHRKYMLEIQTCCSGYEQTLDDYPSGFSLLNLVKPTC